MINRLKANKATALFIILIAASVFLVSSCSALVCLTGLCPEWKEGAKQISWNPPSLSHQSCPDISGKYKSYRNIRDYNELMRLFPSMNDQFDFIHATSKGQKIPDRFIPMPTEKNPSDGIWDQSEFYTSAYVLIQQNEQNLMVSLMSSDGKSYQRQTIFLDSPMIGCANGDFIIREVSILGGGEGTSVGATATEKRFRKLADGQLRLTEHTRHWSYDYLFGVTGIPIERKGTMTFPPAP